MYESCTLFFVWANEVDRKRTIWTGANENTPKIDGCCRGYENDSISLS